MSLNKVTRYTLIFLISNFFALYIGVVLMNKAPQELLEVYEEFVRLDTSPPDALNIARGLWAKDFKKLKGLYDKIPKNEQELYNMWLKGLQNNTRGIINRSRTLKNLNKHFKVARRVTELFNPVALVTDVVATRTKNLIINSSKQLFTQETQKLIENKMFSESKKIAGNAIKSAIK